jgi:2-polyprenyl-3-methyl-5-hydroxy-6-metoxy-1,4-benzoquinol methylase
MNKYKRKLKKIIFGAKLAIADALDLVNVYKMIARSYINFVNKREFLHPPFNIFNERPIEYRFVFEQIGQYYPQRILDVGTGLTALPHLMANCGCSVTAIDNIKDYWSRGLFNRHFYIINDSIVNPKIAGDFDLITCISTLEHIEQFNEAVNSMFRLLKKGGRLILTCPYSDSEFIDNVYARPESDVKYLPAFKTRSYSRAALEKWTAENNAKIIKQEYWQFYTGGFWTAGKRFPIPKQVGKTDAHQISCILLEKN